MASKSLETRQVDKFFVKQSSKETLRFITCGSVDDGKSTLIGRLLFESKTVFEDQLAALTVDSKKFGTQGDQPDFALLVDGLAAEREQGITIDVAYRFFETENRKFVVADTPGHEQYTRNMATGASTASLAIIIVDARKGLMAQTRRHAFITSLLGVKNVVLAINKMDLVNYEQAQFDLIVSEFLKLRTELNFTDVTPIPLSALHGDNVVSKSHNMRWFNGLSLLTHLETVEVEEKGDRPLRLPIQYVIRPNQDFRAYAGSVTSGTLSVGQKVKILPSNFETNIKEIFLGGNKVTSADAPRAVAVTVEGDFDISRGNMLVDPDRPAGVASHLRAEIVWMQEREMLPGRAYIIKNLTSTYRAKLSKPHHRIKIDDFTQVPAKTLKLNDIGSCNLYLESPMLFDPYKKNRSTGSFILIDPETNATAGAGMITFALKRSQNIRLQPTNIQPKDRAAAIGQRPFVLWFTGLSGSGKSTIANILEQKLHAMSFSTTLLDGDNVRHGLCSDLGFTAADRVENIRRISEVSKLMVEAGLITLVSFISPFVAERQMARNLLNDGDFIEIFVDTPLSEAERRDVKGLYKKARAGKLQNFTGIDSPYEKPSSPEITVKTLENDPASCAQIIIDWLEDHEYLRRGDM